MPKGSNKTRDLILGILFFGGLFALGYVTTQLRDLPGAGERQFLNVAFEDVYGVRREDSVLVYGSPEVYDTVRHYRLDRRLRTSTES